MTRLPGRTYISIEAEESSLGSDVYALANVPKKRVRTGCLSCRRRKKKCDETKPKCRNCHRNHLRCLWPGFNSASVDWADPGFCETSGLHCSLDYQRPRKSEISEGNRTFLRYTAGNFPAITSPQSSPPTRIESPVGFSHDNFGQVERPTDDTRESETPLSITIEGRQSVAPDPPIARMLRLIDTDPRVSTYDLFDRYLYITAPRLAVYPCNQDNNPFIEKLVPVAFYSPIAMNSILAVAAAHASAPESRYLYGHVLSHLCSSLYQNHTGTDILVATMMLCFYETAEGDNKTRAMQHLGGLVRLLRIRRLRQIQTEHESLVMEVLLYHVVTSGIHDSLSVKLLSPLCISAGTQPTWENIAGHMTQSHCLSGLSAEMLDIVLEISSLFPMGSNTTLPLDTDTIVKGLALAGRINRWTPPTMAISPLPHAVDENVFDSLRVASLLWKHAAFLNLLLVMHNHVIEATDTRITDIVEEFVILLVTLPLQSSVETCLNWPLVMVGSYAIIPNHRQTIRDRYSSMEWLGFKNMESALSILEDVWKGYDRCGVVDLHKILRRPLKDIVLS